MIRSCLLHLSRNMWDDHPENCRETLVFDEGVWRRLIARCAEVGIDSVFVDVGDGVRLTSHPEIACLDAWSPAKLREEIARCRDLGITLYPKLNFSTTHDAWMKEYSRMVSTPRYYQFCRDVIAETAELFGGPAHFHIGMDEENEFNQGRFLYSVIRHGELWWQDLVFYCEEVRKTGARPWMWADKLWNCDAAEFARYVPKYTVQNNWHYWTEFDFPGDPEPLPAIADFALSGWRRKITEAFGTLADMGFDQVPCGSNWATPENYGLLTEYVLKRIPADKLLGMMMAPWAATIPEKEAFLMAALDQVREAHTRYGIR